MLIMESAYPEARQKFSNRCFNSANTRVSLKVLPASLALDRIERLFYKRGTFFVR